MFSQKNKRKNGGTFHKNGYEQILVYTVKTFSLRIRIWIRMCKTREGIACPLFSKRGSLTVEAALILPLFLLASMTLLSFIDVLRMSIERQMRQQEILRQGAVYANLLGTTTQGREGDYLKIDYVQIVKLPVGGFGYKKMHVRHKNLVHIFNGYDDSCGDRVGWQQAYVYVTKKGQVYHKKRSCSSLNVKIRSISEAETKTSRNVEGKKYRLCKRCLKGYTATELRGNRFFITDYGVHYHIRMNCSELTRTVQVVRIENTGGKRACKVCG